MQYTIKRLNRPKNVELSLKCVRQAGRTRAAPAAQPSGTVPEVATRSAENAGTRAYGDVLECIGSRRTSPRGTAMLSTRRKARAVNRNYHSRRDRDTGI